MDETTSLPLPATTVLASSENTLTTTEEKKELFLPKNARAAPRDIICLSSFRFVSFRFVREREKERAAFFCVSAHYSRKESVVVLETNFYSRLLFEHIMERESVLNSFRLQFHSFFIFHLSLSLVVCNKNTQLFFVLLGRWNLFFFYNFFYGTLTLCPFSFFLSLCVFQSSL